MAKAKMETPSSTKFIGPPRKNKSVASKKWSVFWYLFKLSYAVSNLQWVTRAWINLRDNFVQVSYSQMVKNPPAMEETRVPSLGWKDFLEKGMATHSSILPWRIPWKKQPGGIHSMGSQRIIQDWATKHMQINKLKYSTFFKKILLFGHTAQEVGRILIPWPRVKSVPPTLEAQSANHWTTREVPSDEQI